MSSYLKKTNSENIKYIFDAFYRPEVLPKEASTLNHLLRSHAIIYKKVARHYLAA